MEYFEDLALGPEGSIPSPWWKRIVYSVMCIVRKNQVDTFFNHLNSVDPYLQISMDSPDTDESIAFLDPKCLPNKDHSSKPQSTENQPTLSFIKIRIPTTLHQLKKYSTPCPDLQS